MKKLTKKYKIVYIGNKLSIPVTPEGSNSVCYPGNGTESVEFDTYAEAEEYIRLHNLVYTD